MSFISDESLRSHYAARFHKYGTTGAWSRLASEANSWAYREIVSALTARGYSISQVESWDAGAVYQKSLGLYYMLLIPGPDQEPLAPDVLKTFDRREELKTVLVTISDVVKNPTELPGQPSTGDMAMEDFEHMAKYEPSLTRDFDAEL